MLRDIDDHLEAPLVVHALTWRFKRAVPSSLQFPTR